MVAGSEPGGGDYWWVTDDGRVTAFAIRVDGWARAMVAAASPAALEPLADAMYASDPQLPAVGGEVAVTARLAGAWTERSGGGAEPADGERLYQLRQLSPPNGVPGSGRRATAADVATLADWHLRFCRDVEHDPWPDPEAAMASRVADGMVWVWDDGGPVAMASATSPVAQASRIAQVYTPDDARGRGYGAAVTAVATGDRLAEGVEHCLLVTQLANATSNGIYRRLGYHAVEERVIYRLLPPR
ncbi:MAG: GNAT family N-acetyltransferase [Actinomycetota bacterium]